MKRVRFLLLARRGTWRRSCSTMVAPWAMVRRALCQEQAGSAAGIYKMASSLGAAFGVAISAAIFTALSNSDTVMFANLFLGRTDNIEIRYAAAVALLFNVFMTVVAIISIMITVPKGKKDSA